MSEPVGILSTPVSLLLEGTLKKARGLQRGLGKIGHAHNLNVLSDEKRVNKGWGCVKHERDGPRVAELCHELVPA
ncbi:hypothetical protein [Deinobacterium chartae]|uniref:hypothetical protein n=1 Tax=Deinobacterium chartae TaxID=521158 RepID=UPI001C860B73|nr:hypothetical protein [Deinobacterium chartae]